MVRTSCLQIAALLVAILVGKASAADWLIDPTPFKAAVSKTDDSVTLDNGLVRRVIRIKHGCATVAFDNLASGQNLLRSVRPEAVVQIDGKKFPVGGLSGQPILNYLDPAWLASMKPTPGAFVLESAEAGKTVERFPWKKRPEWMPQDAPWPPPGVSLTLHFRAPSMASDSAVRKVLLSDDFAKLAPEWKPSYSKKHDRTSFQNEGKPGELMALENTFAYVERPLPKGTLAVECTLDAGTDRSASWGPGMVLVFKDQVVKFNLRPNQSAFGVGDDVVGKTEEGKTYTLRMRVDGAAIVCEASTDDKTWKQIGSVNVTGEPTAIRLGKTAKNGAAGDFAGDTGKLERCHFHSFRALGEAEKPAGPATPDTLATAATVDVHYELYDGIPLISKWLVVRNTGKTPIKVDRFVAETLGVVEQESSVEKNPRWELPPLHVETDYAFLGMDIKGANAAVQWKPDPDYQTQVNYERQTPCLLECAPPIGPAQSLAPGDSFESFRVFELAMDSADRERRGLSMRKMYRTIAPWITENPILMHVISADPAVLRRAVDQCADVGFEMIVMSFGSGFNYESRDPAYQATIKETADYARSKGIAIGGYSLLASRGAATGADNTQGVPARYGVMPCLGSIWGKDYLEQLKHFMNVAGLGVLEHDGSYPGDRCASDKHPGHRGLDDSQWVQWKAITDLYKWCRGNGVYLNIPDWYFLTGGSKTGMGYRETNWSLPRAQQEIIERQNIFDGTWDKTGSMGWMFVPLTQYHGGGAAATIEPLKDHLPHYEQRMANLFGAGVQACYRGPRLYDAPETRDAVRKWVAFYKAHRAILDSDMIHLRRADGRDLDYILHVNPKLKEKGLLMVYNPAEQPVTRTLEIPLYYTGLTETAKLRHADGKTGDVKLLRDYKAEIPVTVPAHGATWVVIE